ncbi:P-loop containing nucleoside triphosphate hydrolase [Pseudocohnilembus persalinus]|uniref:GPN-loop GTPase 3 n=1 Tax=Pseudocohnilembus persalinus TaxID=266149 RepID=A0A0V0QWY1_PSEPJ|nr:P-loop containing nucleoside triphosphate hydrolase [Pseudocohnilembus persalinus]|eukprot:KRX06905.1 P-loop containing nucleoside triphosphate hydrolase [Pseudocohnilembus persalinus]
MSYFYGQLIIGPAGSGKSTYCQTLQEMAEVLKRNIIVVNLDPAAEVFNYRCDVDIRDLITLDDVMEELELGPNGGLVYCMEYLVENIDWIQEQIGDLGNDDYVLFDLPGQIEIYTHLELMHKLIKTLQQAGFNLCSMYMLDTTFLSDNQKFISGVLTALTAMMQLSLPHLTVLTKCDLIENKDAIDQFLDIASDFELMPPDIGEILYAKDEEGFKEEIQENEEDKKIIKGVNKLTLKQKEDLRIQKLKEGKQNQQISEFDKKYNNLTQMLKETVQEYSMISMRPLDISDEDSIKQLLIDADSLIQFGENLEPDEKTYQDAENLMNQRYGQFD